jgi:hypothetical protein
VVLERREEERREKKKQETSTERGILCRNLKNEKDLFYLVVRRL